MYIKELFYKFIFSPVNFRLVYLFYIPVYPEPCKKFLRQNVMTAETGKKLWCVVRKNSIKNKLNHVFAEQQ